MVTAAAACAAKRIGLLRKSTIRARPGTWLECICLRLAETGSGTTVHGYRDYSGAGSFGPASYSGVLELRISNPAID